MIDPIQPDQAFEARLKTIEREAERTREFQKVLKELEALQESPTQRMRRKDAEAKAERAKRERQKRIVDLRAHVAALRQKLYITGEFSGAVAAEISQLETELFWLLFAI